MKPSLRLFCLCALPLALAACKGEKKKAQGGTAQGEILPGSASDAMLPLDTVRSQPPLAPETVASGKPGKAAAGTSSGASGEEALPDATEEAGPPSPGAGASAAPTIAPDPAAAQ